MTYQLNVAGLTRELPLCPLSNGLHIAAFILFGDVEMTVACARELLKKVPPYDLIIVPECKGIPLAYEMARQAEPSYYIVARKTPKLYMKDLFFTTVKSITTSQEQVLYIDGAEAETMKGKRVLIVDDVISTGASLLGLEQLIEQAGGIVAGRAAVLAEGDAIGRTDIISLAPLPLFQADGTPILTKPCEATLV